MFCLFEKITLILLQFVLVKVLKCSPLKCNCIAAEEGFDLERSWLSALGRHHEMALVMMMILFMMVLVNLIHMTVILDGDDNDK